MTLSSRIKSSFVAGLILVAPLAVTLYILRFLVNWSLQFVTPVVRAAGWHSTRETSKSSHNCWPSS